MSEFKTTLFKLLNVAGTQIFVDGYEIETVQDYGVDANDEPVLRCECDEDREWYFADQEVVVTDGDCEARTAQGDWDMGDDQFVATLEFRVLRPIEESDL